MRFTAGADATGEHRQVWRAVHGKAPAEQLQAASPLMTPLAAGHHGTKQHGILRFPDARGHKKRNIFTLGLFGWTQQ